MNKPISSRRPSNSFIPLANQIIENAIDAVRPAHLVKTSIQCVGKQLSIQGQTFDLEQFKKIHILGAGKAVTDLYIAIQTVLGDLISGGVLVSHTPKSAKIDRITYFQAAHPLPDARNLLAGQEMVRYINQQVGDDDLVFFLITGGASALLCLPAPGVDFSEKVELLRHLFRSGADILKVNCVRKHISALKGGRLAEMIYPAKIVSLILSDVIDSPMENVGSGPSVGDTATFHEAREILHQFDLLPGLGPTLVNHFQRGLRGTIPDTPLPGHPKFSKNRHFLIGDNKTMLKMAEKTARRLKIPTQILTTGDSGDAYVMAKAYSAIVKDTISEGRPFPAPILLLAGGEATVTVTGKGVGGRNQEFVLQSLIEMEGINQPFFILSMGSDGIDGNSEAAGAWIDETTSRQAVAAKINPEEYLRENDSFHFFHRLERSIITGITATNVMDLRMFYIPESK